MADHYVLIVSRQTRDSRTNKETVYYKKVAGPISQKEALNACIGYANEPRPFECDEALYQNFVAKGLIDP